MAQIKFTKIELAKYTKKRALFLKYLPTLQLKKMLLQAEVFKAQVEIDTAMANYEKELGIVEGQAILLTDPDADVVRDCVRVDKVEVATENIAGIEVPTLQNVLFHDSEINFITAPVWVEDLVSMIKVLKRAYERVEVAKEKKKILEKELRTISTRVNLFEKRMIPDTTKIIDKIKVFLSDQDMAAVASAKVTKNKLLKKKEAMVV